MLIITVSQGGSIMKRLFVILAATTAAAAAVPAHAVTYTTSTEVYGAVGDEIGSPYDIVTLGSATGDFTGFGTYLLNNVSFEVGINSNTVRTVSGVFGANTVTFAGFFTAPYEVAYTLAIDAADTLTLGGNSYRFGNIGVKINELTLNAGVGQIATGELTATVSFVPEPATWAMMIGGIGAAGGALRTRRKAAVSFA